LNIFDIHTEVACNNAQSTYFNFYQDSINHYHVTDTSVTIATELALQQLPFCIINVLKR